ncbi:hypothetical protein BVRB_3g062010 [Beta vulgaris subsp. vulgaris]|uniref:histone-lysine N-methyltransferase, H3 lysine-9 specific SUVH6 n=1 Tax=Beta vulgaris subsp. vulgaris TaxID=3555 RepID=UPI00053FC9B9|nr:histone-lysine N-methyltransferase, H3 lysine-9 specific SUVH6 [Beta vulgaris subsp. vulgaris]XP_010672908.1 histone-lysine N-methyltransferase, H3 lysine-9 specific SUVH6 [Beta vulgaris subsp. vulgaris]XP_048497594.1 histone-lysine N-methyltransferase, H3 lysine-9 specific SUVH6 [Beta vulgaris subsp. vulgaris]KMT15079.1 hypothetical protein BVRB_3g062010 [Beta vulgaris subsp. vulgaris]
MGSVVSEKKPLENGDCSLLMSPPRYKKRKISAIRDFPDGCGPHAAGISDQMKDVESSRQKEGGNLEYVESSGDKGRDLCEVVKGIYPEENVESLNPHIPVFPNGADFERSTVKNDMVERGNEEFLKLPAENPKLPEVLFTMDEESEPKNGIQETPKDVSEKRVKSPSSQKDTSVLDFKEATQASDSKMVDEGTSRQSCSLPHYSLPPDLVWKEHKYPPRKRVSAVRDFPVGCGRNVPRLGDTEGKDTVQLEDSRIDKALLLTDENLIAGVCEADSVCKDNVQDLVSGKGRDTREHYSESDKTSLLNKSYEIKEQDKTSEDKNSEQHGKEIEQSEYDEKDERDSENFLDGLIKDIMVYVKDKDKDKGKSKNKSLVVVPCSNVVLQEESTMGIGSGNDMVIVQGLMSELHCPWRQGKGTVKATSTVATPAVASVRKKKVRKYESSGQDTRKCSPNKSKGDTSNMAEKSMMMVPYVEKDVDEDARPLDVVDDDELSENDESNDYLLLPRGRIFDVSLPPFEASSSSERGIRSKVRETLRLFQVIHRKLLQEEETKSKNQENASKRTDLRAAKVLKDRGKYVNTGKVIGPVPGVEIGDIFNYRIELSIIGLHGPLQGGIDTTKVDKQAVAISIVASGGYANDVDSSDVLIYTGQGGNATGGDKQPEDQKLERGNLALKNCIDRKTLVRVIRGFKETKPSDTPDGRSKTIATYTYDGLYTVEKYWHDLGPHGKLVYKFELRRVPGQPELAWKEVKQSKKHKAREGRCIADISEGKEDVPICAVNTIDDEKPAPFNYITSVMYPDWCQPIPPKGCDCKNGCSDSERCACAVKNGGDIPFNYNGAIVQAKPLVYECGPLCKCPPSCHNRVSQLGIKLPLEVFKTDSRGWGVRCLSAIPSGSFICEYIGELLDDKEAEQRTGNDEYLFDIGQNYNDTSLWDGLSALLPEMTSATDDVIENIGFTIDAVRYGNIGRFINHSCSPNLYAQNVLYDHEDKRIPHIMFFAAENIPPLQELTYHYNYTIDQVFDSLGNIKKKSCHCGSMECSGRMY